METRRPRQQLRVGRAGRARGKLRQRRQGSGFDPLALVNFDLITAAKLRHRRITHVLMMISAEKIVENAEAQGAIGIRHRLDPEFLENRRHDGNSTRHDRHAIGLDALQIEGLGRQLDPELDLWKTAKPFLERWMSEQIGWRGLMRTFKQEAPYLARALPQLPRLVHQSLAQGPRADLQPQIDRLIAAQHQQNRWLAIIALLLACIAATLYY